jgi:hypothetical protein
MRKMEKFKDDAMVMLFVLVALAVCWLSAACFMIFPWTDEFKWWYLPQVITVGVVDWGTLWIAGRILLCEVLEEEE